MESAASLLISVCAMKKSSAALVSQNHLEPSSSAAHVPRLNDSQSHVHRPQPDLSKPVQKRKHVPHHPTTPVHLFTDDNW